MTFGLLSINKPSGPTSHDIVAGVRRGTGIKRVGHAGTLDPLAEGVLVIAVGQATRLVEYLMASKKRYVAQITLGITTDSYDSEGEILSRNEIPDLTEKDIRNTLQGFYGEIEQVPPIYSAIKIRGKSAHARVRAGETVELKSRIITVHNITLLDYDCPNLKLDIECSAGTYIRSIAHDLGQNLGCGAMLSRLTRVSSGSMGLEDSVEWDNLQRSFEDHTWEKYLIPADRAVPGAVQVKLDEEGLKRLENGLPIEPTGPLGEIGRAYSADGRFVGVLLGDHTENKWLPKKVFTSQIS